MSPLVYELQEKMAFSFTYHNLEVNSSFRLYTTSSKKSLFELDMQNSNNMVVSIFVLWMYMAKLGSIIIIWNKHI